MTSLDPEEVVVSTNRTVTVDFTSDDGAILISVQLEPNLAQRVFADATLRDVRPSDLITNALREHYDRIDREPSESAPPRR
jgi:hypothetical protein